MLGVENPSFMFQKERNMKTLKSVKMNTFDNFKAKTEFTTKISSMQPLVASIYFLPKKKFWTN